jgi:hypothetical protein
MSGGASAAAGVDPARGAMVAYAGQLGSYAYFVGACRQYYSKENADAAVASFTGADLRRVDETGRLLKAVWARKYEEGRAVAGAHPWSAAQCERLMVRTVADVKAAKARLDRLTRSPALAAR